MRIASRYGRLGLMRTDGFVDVDTVSGGRFSSDPQAVFDRWEEFRRWEQGCTSSATAEVADDQLEACVPRPRQVFGVGLNYRAHAMEGGFALPENPAIFTKFPTCITGAYADIRLPSEFVDWEIELVVAMGTTAYQVDSSEAWRYVAGVTLGQDISEREVQYWPPAPQFSLGKSYPTFGPIGPELVTSDELRDPDDLYLRCTVNSEVVQQGSTSDLIFSVPELIGRLSAIIPLQPGDLIFTGTMSGVGKARKPPRFLSDGDLLVSSCDEIGTMRNRCVAEATTRAAEAAMSSPGSS